MKTSTLIGIGIAVGAVYLLTRKSGVATTSSVPSSVPSSGPIPGGVVNQPRPSGENTPVDPLFTAAITFVKANPGLINKATRQPYTIKEVYDLLIQQQASKKTSNVTKGTAVPFFV